MQFEIGAIVEGKVTGITKFGAFVELPDGKTGMVHISEVSNAYVKEINDHLTENQIVKVKILKVTPDGKVSLSIKKCVENPVAAQQSAPANRNGPRPPMQRGRRDMGWQGKKPSAEPASFEDMLSRFKATSEDKMSDLKRNTDIGRRSRRGSTR